MLKDARRRGYTPVLSAAGHDGTSLLAAVARVGRLVQREAPPGVGAAHVLRLLWYLPSGAVWRVFGAYAPPLCVAAGGALRLGTDDASMVQTVAAGRSTSLARKDADDDESVAFAGEAGRRLRRPVRPPTLLARRRRFRRWPRSTPPTSPG